MTEKVNISYAQNFEDVILWRALQQVSNGFYIDIGAFDPILDSVTAHFYNNGWSGVNVEPSVELFESFEKDRPNDINLNVAASNESGETTFYYVENTGWSTTNPEIAALLHQRNVEYIERKVKVLSLNDIIEKAKKEVIHFIKIDVEGDEKRVLQGINLQKFRPWIFVIESNIPNSTKQSYEHWEHILLDNNYRFVYYDGLNRYYTSKEKHDDLKASFDVPPNVFDDFIRYPEWKYKQDVDKLNEHILKQDVELQEREKRLSKAIDSSRKTQELTLTVQQQESELAKIRAENAQLVAKTDSHLKTLENKETVIQEKNQWNQNLLKHIEDLTERLENQEVALNEYRTTRSSLEVTINKLQQELENNRRTLLETSITNQTLSEQAASSKSKIQQQQLLLDEINSNNAILLSQNAVIQNEKNAQKSTNHRYLALIEDYVQKIASLEILSKQHEAFQKSLNQQNEILLKQSNQLQKELLENKQQEVRSKKQIKKLVQKIKAHKKALKSKAQLINNFQAQQLKYIRDIEEKSQLVQQLQQQQQHLNTQLQATQTDLAQANHAVVAFQQQLEATQTDFAQVNHAVVAFQQQLEATQTDLAQANHAIAAFQQQNEQLRQNSQQLSQSLQSALSDVSQLAHSNGQYKKHEIRVQELENSLSWKITAPIRWLTKYPMDWWNKRRKKQPIYTNSTISPVIQKPNASKFEELILGANALPAINVPVAKPVSPIVMPNIEPDIEVSTPPVQIEEKDSSPNPVSADDNSPILLGNILDFIPNKELNELKSLLHENSN